MQHFKHTLLLFISFILIQGTLSEIKALIPQTINFAPLTAQTYGNLSYVISATGGASGNPVTFTSSDNTVATCSGINGATIIILKAGNCTITASQLGNATYSDANPVIQTLTVNPKPLLVTGISVNDKPYDATKEATYSNGILEGVINSDDVILVFGTAEFTSKTAGLNKEVTFTDFSISGNDISNYELQQPQNSTADISLATLTIDNLSTISREYNGTKDVLITEGQLIGVLSADDVLLIDGFGEMVSKTIGNNKMVNLSGYSITGNDALNYQLTAPNDLMVDIFPVNLEIIDVIANDKDYDGTTSCILTGGSFIGKIPSDDVTFNYGTALFSDKFVGLNKKVNVSSFTLSGTDAGNYNLIQPTGFSASIFKATPIITWGKPDDIIIGTPLSNTQLNASTTIPGTFLYSPILGTILPEGLDQPLYAYFYPSDTQNYNDADESVLITVINPTSSKQNQVSTITIYPNPISSYITIDNLETLGGIKSITILDIIGNTLISQSIEGDIDEATIDLSSLKSGVYLIVLESTQAKLIKRFVKQ